MQYQSNSIKCECVAIQTFKERCRFYRLLHPCRGCERVVAHTLKQQKNVILFVARCLWETATKIRPQLRKVKRNLIFRGRPSETHGRAFQRPYKPFDPSGNMQDQENKEDQCQLIVKFDEHQPGITVVPEYAGQPRHDSAEGNQQEEECKNQRLPVFSYEAFPEDGFVPFQMGCSVVDHQ